MKKKMFLLAFLSFCLVLSFFVLQPIQLLNEIEGGFLTSYEDVDIANKNKLFGAFISSELKEDSAGVFGQKNENGEIIFKLFGFIPIKKVQVRMESDKDYYIGGVPIGLDINSSGMIVVSENEENKTVKRGDIITKIDGIDSSSIDDVSSVLENGKNVELEILRNNKKIKTSAKTFYDEGENRLKLGLWVKDDVSGVGTLTFVDKQSLDFAALGHALVDSTSENIVPVSDGKVYACNLIGIDKGKKNAPGQLRCVFVPSSVGSGVIENNTKFGIHGKLSDKERFIDENKTAKLGGRLGVKPGKAKLISSISGIREEYDIEIIKASYQKSAKDKSLVIRVKDERLLALTGGIVQGMSGSPIMQDEKIVGAVTHVFTSDPTKGYGVYADWMI